MQKSSKHGYYTHLGDNIYKHSEKTGTYRYYPANRTMVAL